MNDKILRELRILKVYSLTLTVALVAVTVMSFSGRIEKQAFTEIDVERINVIEKDGTIKMVISNQKRQHPGMIDGKLFPERQREAGMIFFNTEGDECGGLVYDGDKQGGGMALSFDQYKNDQVMQMTYTENLISGQRERSYGLKLWDRSEAFPLNRQIALLDSLKQLNDSAIYKREIQKIVDKGLIGQQRLFMGKTKEQNVGLFINDEKGRPRIKLYVDNKGNPAIEFLDANGKKVPVK